MLIALSDINSFKNESSLPDLPHVIPIFFVPPLEDVPKNPIMDSLKIEQANLNLPTRMVRLKSRVETHVQHLADAWRPDLHELLEETVRRAQGWHQPENREAEVETLWAEAGSRKIRVSCVIIHFCTRFLSHRRMAYFPGINSGQTAQPVCQKLYFYRSKTNLCWLRLGISELSLWSNPRPRTYFDNLDSVQPLLRDPTHTIKFTTQRELVTCLKTNRTRHTFTTAYLELSFGTIYAS